MLRFAAITLAVLVLSACGTRKTVEPAAGQEWFRVTLGASDTQPADWSGTLELAGGRVTGMTPWRFDKEDRLDSGARTWRCSTRFEAVLDPKFWWLGAIHVVPRDFTMPKARLIPNGFYFGVEGTSEVRLKTAQGEVRFTPASVTFGAPASLMNGRVEVERAIAPQKVTGAGGMQEDYPAIAENAEGEIWTVWTGYSQERETLFAARADGSGRKLLSEGEFFRPAMAAGPGREIHLVVSVNAGKTWRIGYASYNGRWSGLEMISDGGPDLFPRAAVAPDGRLWVVWQGFRGNRSRILARTRKGGKWEAEYEISQNSRNAWMPSVACDSSGGAHFAWDAYDDGVYNVYYRAWRRGSLAAMRRVNPSARFQAHASVACDRTGAPWLAWDEAGANWGKDTGFLIKANRGEALYEQRQVRVVKLTDAAMLAAPALPAGFLEQPQLVVDAKGGIGCLVRRRNVKLHEVYSQTLKRNRLQQYSIWDYALAALDGARWSQPVALPYSDGRNDLRAAIAARRAGGVAMAWAGDGRSFSRPYPFVRNEVHTGVTALPAGAAPALSPVAAEADKAAAVHPEELKQVTRLRAERLPAAGKQLRILRGDMHRHTDISFDGDLDGSIWDCYRYAIDAAELDYLAVTDHNAGDDSEYFWWITQKSNDLFHYPGRFTPVYAYERSLRYPNGHRNLVWPKRGVRTLYRSRDEEDGARGAGRLYRYLKETGGLAMSHTSATTMGTDWRDNDPDIETLVEIYQGDRTSYEHDGAPKAPRKGDPYSQPGGYESAGYVWNAWAKGYKLGVQASSDHASTHVSYAVLLAEDLSREAILKAIKARSAYAATDNILLDVRCGPHLQGDVFSTSERPRLAIRIAGTAPVTKVDIVKNNKYVFSASPGKAEVELAYEDRGPSREESYYYVRIQQSDGQMAWSSPMWIRYEAK